VCHASIGNGRFANDNVEYRVGNPGGDWEQMRLPTANVAWHNYAIAASILVNSHCEGVGDSPLEGLASDLMMGMTEREVLQQQLMPWARREALETTATARLDGVPRKLVLFVLKKDRCVYDIVLDASPDSFEKARAAYLKVRDGFSVDPRRDGQ